MKAKDVPKSEFIGLIVEIVESKNPSLTGIKGKIVNETKNTFDIETKNTTKRVIKDQITFTTKIKGKKVKIKGEILKARPEDRIKKRHRI